MQAARARAESQGRKAKVRQNTTCGKLGVRLTRETERSWIIWEVSGCIFRED